MPACGEIALLTHSNQKGFIIATLMSTVAGTFLTGLNLYDSISERRNQNKRDKGQDQRIKEIEKRLGEDDNAKNDRRKSGNDLRDSLEYSGPMVRREYDQHFARMGPKFAQGDSKRTWKHGKVKI